MLGTRQSDVPEGACLSQADLSIFVSTFFIKIHENGIQKHRCLQLHGLYAFVIYSKLCVDPSTHKTSI